MTDQPAWTLLEFLPQLDEWIAIEHPLPELRVLLTDWIFTRVSPVRERPPRRGLRRLLAGRRAGQ